jgi:hypothetical protein
VKWVRGEREVGGEGEVRSDEGLCVTCMRRQLRQGFVCTGEKEE